MIRVARGWREGLSLSAAVILTVAINHFWIAREETWVLMAMIAMLLATRGKPFRLGVLYGITMVAAVGLAGFLSVDRVIGVYIVLPIIFYIAGNMIAPITYLFLLMFMLAFLLPAGAVVLIQDRMINVGLGCLMGYLAGQIILPANIASEFRRGLQPTLGGLREYMRAITSRIKRYRQPDSRVEVAASRIELILSGGQGSYPEWVYDAGFNPGLRAGFRFFLIRVERLMELLMSLNCIVERIHYHHLPDAIMTAINDCMQTNESLLNIILTYLQSGKLDVLPEVDYETDVALLEREMAVILPANLDLMDLSDHYVEMAALLYTIRDLRKTLLQMVLAIGN